MRGFVAHDDHCKSPRLREPHMRVPELQLQETQRVENSETFANARKKYLGRRAPELLVPREDARGWIHHKCTAIFARNELFRGTGTQLCQRVKNFVYRAAQASGIQATITLAN